MKSDLDLKKSNSVLFNSPRGDIAEAKVEEGPASPAEPIVQDMEDEVVDTGPITLDQIIQANNNRRWMGPVSDTSDDEKEQIFAELVVLEDDDDAVGSKALEVRPAVACEEPEGLNNDLIQVVCDSSE